MKTATGGSSSRFFPLRRCPRFISRKLCAVGRESDGDVTEIRQFKHHASQELRARRQAADDSCAQFRFFLVTKRHVLRLF